MSTTQEDFEILLQARHADMLDELGRMQGATEAMQGASEQDVEGIIAASSPGIPSLDEQIPEIEPMSDDDLLAEVNHQLKSSLDGLDGELVGAWRLALQYYEGAYNREGARDQTAGCIDPETGLSDIASLDIADMVESLMAQIMPSFEGAAIFRFGAVGQTDEELSADEKRAEQESEAVNHVLMCRNNGYSQIQSMFRDALLMRCGYAKVTTDTNIRVQIEEYEQLTVLEFMRLNMDPMVSIGRIGPRYLVRRYLESERVNAEAVPQEEIKLSNGWHSPFLDGIPFIAHSRIVRRSELMELGYSKELIDQIPTESQESNEVAVQRSTHSSENQYYDNLEGSEPVRYSECYIKIDWDRDGFPERRRVCLGGQALLMDNTPIPEQPFVMAVPIQRSHRATGWSLFDKLKDVQDVKSESLNQHINNLRWCNQPDVDVVHNQVQMDDLLARRPGGINRMKSPGAIQRNAPIPVGQDALNLLEYLDKMRSERGGASLDLQSAQMQVAGDTAHGIERQISSKEQMASFMASTLVSTGLVPLVKKIHAEMRRGGEPFAFRSQGRTIQANPQQWPEREVVDITSAITLGDQMRQQQALNGILAAQQGLSEQGYDGVLTDLQGQYNALIDAGRLARLTNPAQYWVDPTSAAARQVIQTKAQQQQAAQQEQARQLQMQQQFQWTLAQLQKEIADTREQTKFLIESAKLAQNAQIEAAKIAEDARQANQDAGVDLTKIEAETGKDVPGSAI